MWLGGAEQVYAQYCETGWHVPSNCISQADGVPHV